MEPSTLRQRLVAALFAGLFAATPGQGQVWEPGNLLITAFDGDEDGAFYGAAIATGDFDDDGLDDLAIGSPRRNTSAGNGSGYVEILMGRPDRSPVTSARYVGASAGDELGSAIAAGDFDGDGRDELAIGAPRAEVGSIVAAGHVLVLGYEPGPGWIPHGYLVQGQDGLPGTPEPIDQFGSVLASGDFDDDGFDDLAVGVPSEDWSGTNEGAAIVIYGSPTGLTPAGSQIFGAGRGGVLGVPADEDAFGAALAAADFDVDGFDDLAIGAPWGDVGAVTNAGQVHVLRGAAAGLTAEADQLLDVVAADPDAAWGTFGGALAAGDFDHPGLGPCIVTASCAPDLAVGAPNHQPSQAGRVTVLFGAPESGLSTVGARVVTEEDVPGGEVEDFDFFGTVLATGSIDRDSTLSGDRRAADLIVGAPFESVGPTPGAGAAYLLFGGAGGPDAHGAQTVEQSTGLGAAPPAPGESFGAALAAGDFDGDGWGDLAIGAPGEVRPGGVGAGAVQVLWGALFSDGFERTTWCGWSSPPCP